MPRPKGLPKTGGRKKGSTNKATKEKEFAIIRSGMSPKEFMLRIMDGVGIPAETPETEKLTLQFEAAKAVAPYIHPRLQAIQTQEIPPPETTPTVTLDVARRIAYTLRLGVQAKRLEEKVAA